jgi:hypothetical protein
MDFSEFFQARDREQHIPKRLVLVPGSSNILKLRNHGCLSICGVSSVELSKFFCTSRTVTNFLQFRLDLELYI